MMTLGDLREYMETLEELPDELPLRLAFQPEWPLAFEISVISIEENSDGEPVTLWIASGNHPHRESPYASKEAWEGGTFRNETDEEDTEEQS